MMGFPSKPNAVVANDAVDAAPDKLNAVVANDAVFALPAVVALSALEIEPVNVHVIFPDTFKSPTTSSSFVGTLVLMPTLLLPRSTNTLLSDTKLAVSLDFPIYFHPDVLTTEDASSASILTCNAAIVSCCFFVNSTKRPMRPL